MNQDPLDSTKPFTQGGSMTRKEMIESAVAQELAREPEAAFSHIQVSATEGGVVTLKGTVPTVEDMASAEKAVLRVPGVRAIDDELEGIIGVGP